MQKTEGHWWTQHGWLEGVCHHDTHVQKIEPKNLSDQAPLFIPAPVDLHVHGGGGKDCMGGDEAIETMLVTHALHGAGALLATSVTAPFDDITSFIDSVSRVMNNPPEKGATLLGAHLEGPFISPDKLGAQPPHAAKLDTGQLKKWLDSGVIRVITFAPENDQDGKIVELCDQYNVRAQIGHTNCSWAAAQRCLKSGCGVTHLFNAMSGVNHRDSGAATASLAYADYAEIITDGFHVERAAFDAAKRAIPNLYSVTDATAATGMSDGDYRLGSLRVTKAGNQVYLPDGTLAGSCLTQLRSLSVLRDWNVDWHGIGSMVSSIPARWIGEPTLGNTSAGSRSHWLEITQDEPVALWLSGERIALTHSC